MTTFQKALAALSAAVLCTTALTPLAGAANGLVDGDLDGDGIITEHDSLLLENYLAGDTDLLTPEKAMLADVNGDGVVDQTGAAQIAQSWEFEIGDILGFGQPTIQGAYMALWYYTNTSVGNAISVVSHVRPAAYPEDVSSYGWSKGRIHVNGVNLDANSPYFNNIYTVLGYGMVDTDEINLAHLNLLDTNGDNKVDMSDAYLLLLDYAKYTAGF